LWRVRSIVNGPRERTERETSKEDDAFSCHTQLQGGQLFDRIAERYCHKDLLPASRVARRHRLTQTLKVAPLGRNLNILEVGCGAGFTASYLQSRYESYCGVDCSQELIKCARIYNRRPNASFHVADIRDFKPETRFDVLLAVGVLHHIEDIEQAMEHIVELIEPGGWLLVNEPSLANPLIRLARRVRMSFDSEYSNDQRGFSAPQLRSLLEQAGLTKVRIVPQGVLSTPFAEIRLPFQFMMRILAGMACFADSFLETHCRALCQFLSWNFIAAGCKR